MGHSDVKTAAAMDDVSEPGVSSATQSIHGTFYGTPPKPLTR